MKISTIEGELRVVSFKNFVEKYVRIHIVPNDIEFVNYITTTNSYSSGCHGNMEDAAEVDSHFLQDVAFIKDGDPISAATVTVGSQFMWSKSGDYSSLETMAEYAHIEQSMRHGDPKYFVRFSNRRWFLANPEDFVLYKNNKGVALVNAQRHRFIIYTIYRKYK